jgi:lipopolysaccharide/colanic/teichoic acid biosynthesis glycosyltransferase
MSKEAPTVTIERPVESLAESHEAIISFHTRKLFVPDAPEPHLAYNATKRILDIVVASLVLVATSPVFLIVALVNSRGGGVFYRQRRLGLGGRVFVCYKFRSMVPGAEELREQIESLNITRGPTFKNEEDPRVTRIGRVLRRTSLDELPQLLNVIRGEMSLVGPRPLAVDENRYRGYQHLRLSVMPGLTCIWQVSGRSTIAFDRWMDMDLEYVDTRSLAKDLSLLIRTVPAVLSGDGAY